MKEEQLQEDKTEVKPKKYIWDDPLFYRTYIFILGLLTFLLACIMSYFTVLEDGWFVPIVGILIGLGVGYLGMLWMLAAFADDETYERRVQWLYETPVLDPIGFVFYIVLIFFLGFTIGLLAVIITYALKGFIYLLNKCVNALY